MRKYLWTVILFVLLFAGYSAGDEGDGPLLQEICHGCGVNEPKMYTPYGFTAEFAYAGPSVLRIDLLGLRYFRIKHKVLVGLSGIAADIDFDGWKVSDEGILGIILCFSTAIGSIANGVDPGFWLSYLLFGNTYYPLTDDDGVGLFESHHIVDYAIYGANCGKPWEFGFTEAAGVRLVYAKGSRGGKNYLDLGGNVRWTNKSFRFGVFVLWGGAGTST